MLEKSMITPTFGINRNLILKPLPLLILRFSQLLGAAGVAVTICFKGFFFKSTCKYQPAFWVSLQFLAFIFSLRIHIPHSISHPSGQTCLCSQFYLPPTIPLLYSFFCHHNLITYRARSPLFPLTTPQSFPLSHPFLHPLFLMAGSWQALRAE